MNTLWCAIGVIVILMFVVTAWIGVKAHRQEISLEEQGLWVKLIRDESTTLLIPPVIDVIKSDKLDPMSVVFLIGLCVFLIAWTDYWKILNLRANELKDRTNKEYSTSRKDTNLSKKSNGVFLDYRVSNDSIFLDYKVSNSKKQNKETNLSRNVEGK